MFRYDYDFGCELHEAQKFCADNGYEVVEFIEYGPAGGNPNLTIRFKDLRHFIEFIWLFVEGNPDYFIEDLVTHLRNLPIRAITEYHKD